MGVELLPPQQRGATQTHGGDGGGKASEESANADGDGGGKGSDSSDSSSSGGGGNRVEGEGAMPPLPVPPIPPSLPAMLWEVGPSKFEMPEEGEGGYRCVVRVLYLYYVNARVCCVFCFWGGRMG